MCKSGLPFSDETFAPDYHFVRGNIQAGAMRVKHVKTKYQLADSLTKPLLWPLFTELKSKIGVKELPPSWERV